GVRTGVLAVAAALAMRARTSPRRSIAWIAAGVAMGIATLVRPQNIALAPVLGLLALPGDATRGLRARAAAIVTGVALLCCAPWTARNCVRMERCALVSVNGGWDLPIGAQTARGAWASVGGPRQGKTPLGRAPNATAL